MTPETKKRIHLIYGILLTAVTILAGICFIVSCYNIYHSGIVSDADQIYSREIVAAAFSKIAIPVYACLALVILGFLLYIVVPPEKKKLAPEKNLPLILERLHSKTDLTQCDPALVAAINGQKKQRKLHVIISAALMGVCSVIFLIYACNGEHWTEVTASMVQAMKWFVPCLLIPFAYIVFTAYFCRKSLAKEIDLLKQASVQAPRKAEKPLPKLHNPYILHGLQLALLVIGIGAIIYGVAADGVEGVISKAVAICTECIGLG